MFGEITEEGSIGWKRNAYSFTGKPYDPIVNMYYFGARWYDANVGCFITKDKNLWGFVPTNFTPDDVRLLSDRNYSPSQILEDTILFQAASNPKNFHKYLYVGNNPINYIDPTGDIALLPILAAVWVAYEIGSGIYDIYTTYQVLTDPNTTMIEKGITAGLLSLSLIGPGGGYATGAKIIKGFTRHGIDRMIDRGIKPQWILDAVRNPREITHMIDEKGRKSFRYVGKDATVVLNERGEVVTCWPK